MAVRFVAQFSCAKAMF